MIGDARLRALSLLCLFAAVACGAPPEQPTCGRRSSEVPAVFIAFAADFCGYHSWQSFDTTGGAKAGGIHDGSTVTEYLNRPPPHGSTSFPVGTMIVKEATPGDQVHRDAGAGDGGVGAGQAHELFAMVKRGGGYNPGAPGWAWYDLKNTDKGDDSVTVTWGPAYGPPLGDTYGGDATAGCNTCHKACGNDAVCAKPLFLSNF